jgi:hypothetical protein
VVLGDPDLRAGDRAEDATVNPVLEAVLAIATLAGAAGLLAFLDWLTGHWHRPVSPAAREAVAPVLVRPGAERIPYGTGGIYTLGTEGDDAA